MVSSISGVYDGPCRVGVHCVTPRSALGVLLSLRLFMSPLSSSVFLSPWLSLSNLLPQARTKCTNCHKIVYTTEFSQILQRSSYSMMAPRVPYPVNFCFMNYLGVSRGI